MSDWLRRNVICDANLSSVPTSTNGGYFLSMVLLSWYNIVTFLNIKYGQQPKCYTGKVIRPEALFRGNVVSDMLFLKTMQMEGGEGLGS